MNTRAMVRVSLMVAVMAIAAQIAIPIQPVPFTLQVLGVFLSGFLLGPKHGAIAQAIYLLVGVVGVPVFANFGSGLEAIVGPTGGYLVSYPFAAALAGLAASAAANAPRRRAIVVSCVWGCISLAVIYAVGATWLAVVTQLPIAVAIAQGILPFVAFDLVKVGLAAAVATTAAPVIATSRA